METIFLKQQPVFGGLSGLSMATLKNIHRYF